MAYPRRRICSFGVGLLVAIAAGCGTATGTEPGAAGPSGKPTVGEYATWFGGVRVGVRVAFDKNVHIAAAKLVSGSRSQPIGIYPLTGGTDPEPPPKSLDVGAGDQVLLEGELGVRCDGTRQPPPVFEVSTTSAQQTIQERFVPSNSKDFRRTIAKWCARPPAAMSRNVRSYPDGRYAVLLEISNPGPAAAQVILRSSNGAKGTWRAAQTTAAAGQVTQLSVTGRGPVDCGIDPPWANNHLLIDGRAVQPDDEEWCG